MHKVDNTNEYRLCSSYCIIYSNNMNSSKISKLKYTIGIKSVLKQKNGYASISKTDIADLIMRSENTLTSLIIYKPKIGDTVKINKGVFKNHLAQVIGLKGKDRISLMLNSLLREILIDFSFQKYHLNLKFHDV